MKSIFVTTAYILIVLVAVLSRLIPHVPNATPITALALLGGSVMPLGWGIALALGSMVISDLILGFHDTIIFTWGSFILIALLGKYLLQTSRKPTNLIVASGLSSILFFVVSNLGVWLMSDMYQKSLVGLLECFTMAIPFFRGTFWGDLLYTSIVFVAYEIIIAVGELPTVQRLIRQKA